MQAIIEDSDEAAIQALVKQVANFTVTSNNDPCLKIV